MAALRTELISESLNWSETHIKRCAIFRSAFDVMKEQKAGGIIQENPETIYHKQKR